METKKPRLVRRGFFIGVAASAYAIVMCADLLATAFGYDGWRALTKPPLMVLLALVLVALRPRLDVSRRWLLAALLWSSVGDAVLLSASDRAFVFGTLAFAFAHVAFILAFASAAGGTGLVRRRPWVALPYFAGWALSTIVVAPHMGALAVVALPYSLLLTVMAVFALDTIGRIPLRNAVLAATGALLFMISDGTIAIARFDPAPAPPHVAFLIMLLYVGAQTAMTLAFALPGVATCDRVRRA